MILYHGSYIEVAKPDYWRGREKLDFGCANQQTIDNYLHFVGSEVIK
jgi:hypothetical protein